MDRQEAYRQALIGFREDLVEAEARVQRIRAAIASVQELMASPSRIVPSSPEIVAPRMGAQPLSANGSKPKTMTEAAEIVLRSAGRPLHIRELVHGIQAMKVGNPDATKLRLSLVGSLDRKTAAEEVFTKPKPATYGLREWGE